MSRSEKTVLGGATVKDNGKEGLAPCGHTGHHVIGAYVACPLCDSGAAPVEVNDEPVTNRICSFCGSNDIEVFDLWGPARYHCLPCGRVFT